MKTPSINFSHDYAKLKVDGKNIKTATLLMVLSMNHDQFTKEFIDYDTDFGKYKLQFDTLYLMLIFQKGDGNIFTTLRPQFNRYGNKKPYYEGLIGKEFDVLVAKEKEVSHV